MRLNKVLGVGDTVAAEDAEDMLTALNAMLDSWATERLLVYVDSTDTISLTAGDPSFTVGPTGETVSGYPIKVLNSTYVTVSGVDYPVSVISHDQYAAIRLKSQTGIPQYIFQSSDVPNATMYLYPVPSVSATISLSSQKLLTSFATTATNVTLPAGYENAIVYSLAEETAPEFGAQLDPRVSKKASSLRKKIKRINTTVPQLEMPSFVMAYSAGLVA